MKKYTLPLAALVVAIAAFLIYKLPPAQTVGMDTKMIEDGNGYYSADAHDGSHEKSSDEFEKYANSSQKVAVKFSLTDARNGKAVSEKSYYNKVKLIFFGFTNCTEVCPTAVGSISSALQKLSQKQLEKVQVLFITIDPKRDTEAVMKNYVSSLHKNITGLVGTKQEIKAAETSFKVYSGKRKSDEQIDHSGFIYLADTKDNIVDVIPYSTAPKEILEKLSAVL